MVFHVCTCCCDCLTRNNQRRLCDLAGVYKESKYFAPDKQAHPLLIAFAGPGQGKSQLLTEFPPGGGVSQRYQEQEFDDAGAPTNFAKFRAQCRADLSPEDVIGLVLPREQRSLATVVIGLDGMQNLLAAS